MQLPGLLAPRLWREAGCIARIWRLGASGRTCVKPETDRAEWRRLWPRVSVLAARNGGSKVLVELPVVADERVLGEAIPVARRIAGVMVLRVVRRQVASASCVPRGRAIAKPVVVGWRRVCMAASQKEECHGHRRYPHLWLARGCHWNLQLMGMRICATTAGAIAGAGHRRTNEKAVELRHKSPTGTHRRSGASTRHSSVPTPLGVGAVPDASRSDCPVTCHANASARTPRALTRPDRR